MAAALPACLGVTTQRRDTLAPAAAWIPASRGALSGRPSGQRFAPRVVPSPLPPAPTPRQATRHVASEGIDSALAGPILARPEEPTFPVSWKSLSGGYLVVDTVPKLNRGALST